jgi:hypothetical protein
MIRTAISQAAFEAIAQLSQHGARSTTSKS